MAEKPAFVLDTFAFLAYLRDEPAAPRVQKLLMDAEKSKCILFISLINLGEILYSTERRGGISKVQDTLALVQRLPIEVLPVDEQTVFAAAHIKANHTISYADSFVVAIGIEENAMVITADPEFHSVEQIVEVEWLQAAD